MHHWEIGNPNGRTSVGGCRERLDHIIVFNERHLRRVLREFVRHYNEVRPHQTLELQVPDEQSRASPVAGNRIHSRPVLGGLTHE